MKVLISFMIFMLGLNLQSRSVDFNKTPSGNVPLDYNSQLFQQKTFITNLIFERSEEFDMGSFLKVAQFNFKIEPLQTSKSSTLINRNGIFYDEVPYFCGLLKDGLYLNTKSSYVMLSRLFDTFVNDYLISRWLFPKNKN